MPELTEQQAAALNAAITQADRDRVKALMVQAKTRDLTSAELAEVHAIAMKAAAIVPPPARIAATMARVERSLQGE